MSFVAAKAEFAKYEADSTLSQATLAGGCFWCMEGPFQETKGVRSVGRLSPEFLSKKRRALQQLC